MDTFDLKLPLLASEELIGKSLPGAFDLKLPVKSFSGVRVRLRLARSRCGPAESAAWLRMLSIRSPLSARNCIGVLLCELSGVSIIGVFVPLPTSLIGEAGGQTGPGLTLNEQPISLPARYGQPSSYPLLQLQTTRPGPLLVAGQAGRHSRCGIVRNADIRLLPRVSAEPGGCYESAFLSGTDVARSDPTSLMSEELGRENRRVPIEPPLGGTSSSLLTASPAVAKRQVSVPGGGSKLSSSDQPGDPYATLIVLSIDGLVAKKTYTAPRTLPSAVDEALTAAVRLVDERGRCVVVVSGGSAMPQACMQALVQRMPGGLDSFGRGRKIESLVKEASAEYGNLWESALLVKMVAKRQAALVRFGAIVVLSASALAPATSRVYSKCFEDWRVLEGGGRGRGGRDLPIEVAVEAVEVAEADRTALEARAALMDGDAWFDRSEATYCHHPSWPQRSASSPQRSAKKQKA